MLGFDTKMNRAVGVLLALVVFLATGCGEKGPAFSQLPKIHNNNIKRLRVIYNYYMATHGMVGPKDEQTLKDFLNNDPGMAVKLKRLDLTPDQVDEIFVSERDGKPFKVRYGLRGMGDHAIVFRG